jgi:hypothetical protein
MPVHSLVQKKIKEPALLHNHYSKKRKSQRTSQRTVGLLVHGSEALVLYKYFKEPPNTVLDLSL